MIHAKRATLLLIGFGLLYLGWPASVNAEQPDFKDNNTLNVAVEGCLGRDAASAITFCSQILASNLKLTLNQLIALYSARGNAYNNTGDAKRAIDDYNEVLKVDPKNSDAYTNRGAALMKAGDSRRAIDDFGQAISLNPNLADAYYNRGVVYRSLNNCADATSDFDKVVQLNPNFVNSYYALGVCAQETGDLDDALSKYNEAVRLNPQFADALYNRGAVYAAQGQLSKAILDFGSVIEIDARYAPAYYNLGVVYLSIGKTEEAIGQFNSALAIDPTYVQALYNRGTANLNQGDFKQAILDLTSAITIFEQASTVNDGRIYSFEGRTEGFSPGNSKAADSQYKSIEANAFYNRGRANHKTGQYEKAISDYDAAALLDSGIDVTTFRALAQARKSLSNQQ
jgi:tetratricopeptide (TPR) repeat protein